MARLMRTLAIDAALGAAAGAALVAGLLRRGGDRRRQASPPAKKTGNSREAFDRYLAAHAAQRDAAGSAPIDPPAPHLPVHRAPRTIKLRTLALLAAGLASVGIVGAAGFVYFGVYDVSATEQHTPPFYYLVHYAMERSVSMRANKVEVPDLSPPERFRKGFVLYREHCVQCHGAPGVAPGPAAIGLRPEPLDLAERSGREWRAAEVYRVIKHGLKLTGMPAWQFRLSEDDMWNLTAFIKRLPNLSPVDYRNWERAEANTRPEPPARDRAPRPGDVKAGKYAMQQYLCTTCHTIPGVTGADKTVGPPLGGIAKRKYIGGVLENTPENMIRWLRDPQQIDPLSAMPNMRIKDQDILDMVAYLYTLEK